MPRDGDAFVVDVVGRGDTISASKTEFSLPAFDRPSQTTGEQLFRRDLPSVNAKL